MTSVLDADIRVVPGRAHRDEVERIFQATMLAGSAMPHRLDGTAAYSNFCLNWYFTHRDGRVFVAERHGRAVGYALVALNPDAYASDLKRHLATLTARTIGRLVTFRLSRDSRRFYLDRMRDSWRIWRTRHRIDLADEPHAHMNVESGERHGGVSSALIAAIDAACGEVGFVSWIGEVNAVAGHRRRALERIVGAVLDERPNVTASRLCRQPIVRYTVRRSLTGSRVLTMRG